MVREPLPPAFYRGATALNRALIITDDGNWLHTRGPVGLLARRPAGSRLPFARRASLTSHRGERVFFLVKLSPNRPAHPQGRA